MNKRPSSQVKKPIRELLNYDKEQVSGEYKYYF